MRNPAPTLALLAAAHASESPQNLFRGFARSIACANPAVLFALPPALWARGRNKRRPIARRAPSRPTCPYCGYDVRATPDRCPECGTIPADA